MALGARLFTESGSAHVDRLGGYWQAWTDHGDELPIGEIDDVWSEHG